MEGQGAKEFGIEIVSFGRIFEVNVPIFIVCLDRAQQV